MITFNPDKQDVYCKHIDKCLTGDTPSLTRLSITYGEQIVKSWLVIQILDIAKFCGIKDKPSIDNMVKLSGVIANNYSYLKVTELMVFFYRFKAGEYGKFYGVIDNMVLTDALYKFLDFRKQQIDKIEKQKEAKRIESVWNEMNENSVSREEYELIKWYYNY